LVGTSRDSLELHRKAHDAGLTTDVTVTYSHDDEKEVAESFEAVRDLDNETGGVRTVVLVPDTEMSEVEGPTTAYQDLRVVSAARLYFDDLNIRVSREDVTDKLAQTALEFGADDVGFVEEGEFDVELVIREAGFEPVKRGRVGEGE
ncbi:MAG: hypothetical protein SV760_01225, partial [Halobacteria archaeon]|nr:hypothetical protein [Halobacteria archaeon]